MKKWLVIGLVALVSVIIGLIKYNRKLQKEYERQSGNIAILMKDIKSYKIRDSLNAVSVSALNLTIDELKEYRDDDAQTIKELGIKNKHFFI